MKKYLLSILVVFLGVIHLSAQEVTLFSSRGEATAYIDYSENGTIFLWDGTPVAFLENAGNEFDIIGFNGNFLGWYSGGIVYDQEGNPVGARKGAVNMITRIEGIKGIKQIIPIRPIAPIAPNSPIWGLSWSRMSLYSFLYAGKD